jgi:hypothetical protein
VNPFLARRNERGGMNARELAARGWALARTRHRSLLLPALLVVPFHVEYGDIISQIEQAILGFFASIWNGIQSFFGTIFSAIANTFAAIFNAPVQAIQNSFAQLGLWANHWGPLSPIIVLSIVGVAFLIAVFLLWLMIRFSVHAAGETAEETEEGA